MGNLQNIRKRLTADEIKSSKGDRKLTCLTAYTAPMASMLGAHSDMLLVGDSVGMVLHGMENTLGVTLDMMILHGQAVMRGVHASDVPAFVIVDMPYGSYEGSKHDALANATRIMDETGAHAVKLEGGQDMAGTIAHLVQHGVPVMGHIGLQPQSVEKEGGYRIKGRSDDEITRLIEDAKAIEAAGVFSFVLEGTVENAAQLVTQSCSVPVIGIGASNSCDGQVLVSDDMLGMHTGHVPKFVKQYKKLSDDIDAAAAQYVAEVQSGVFPAQQHLYGVKKVKAS